MNNDFFEIWYDIDYGYIMDWVGSNPSFNNPWDAVIAKWELIAEFHREYPGKELYIEQSTSCAFCIIHQGDFCKDCPIAKFMGEVGCRHTPIEWYALVPGVRSASAMLEFLYDVMEGGNG